MAVTLQAGGVLNATCGDFLSMVNLEVPVADAFAREGRKSPSDGISVRPGIVDIETLRTKRTRPAQTGQQLVQRKVAEAFFSQLITSMSRLILGETFQNSRGWN